MNNKTINLLLALIPFASIIFLWFLFYHFSVHSRWLIPSPLETITVFWQLTIDGTLIKLILISAKNAIPAFIFALICAFILGTLIGINETIRRMFFPFLSAIYPIPSLAWLPLIIIFLGFSRETIWCTIFISSFMRIIYNVIGGVRGVDRKWILAAKNLGLNRIEIIFKVILPGALPQIITGMRLGFGNSWRSLIGAEMLVVSLGGLGKFIWMAQWFFDFNKVLIGIIVISFIGLFIEEVIFKKIEKITLIRWGLIHE